VQAARIAGETRMPVIIKEAAGTELLELALVENIQRQDLNPLEEALAFGRLNDEFQLTQDQIAQRVGRSRASIGNVMRILLLPKDIQESIASGQISEGHARALMSIDDPAVRLDAWRRIVADDLTVRQAEEIAKALKATAGGVARRTAPAPMRERDPEERALEDDLRSALGAKVALRRGRHGGRIVISFHNDDELEGILRRMGLP
jgi:ParB family chromosome partitioning protein